MAQVIESFDSRKFGLGPDGRQLALKFTVVGVASEDDVSDLVRAECPVTLSGLVRGQINADPLGGGVWKVEVPYSSRLNEGQAAGETPTEPTPPEGSQPLNSSQPGGFNLATLSFDTSGGTTHITQSIATRSRTRRGGGAAPDYKQAIGVSRDGVAGCDIFSPKLEVSITVEMAYVSLDYIYGLRAITGRVNTARFWNFAPEECLYLGGSGQSSSDGKWSVTHKMALGETQLDVAICAGLTVPEVRAWDYLWVAYEDSTDANSLISIPAAAYVEQVYRGGNFRVLGLGG